MPKLIERTDRNQTVRSDNNVIEMEKFKISSQRTQKLYGYQGPSNLKSNKIRKTNVG